MSNPKGGNRAFSIRIRGRYILVCSRHHMERMCFQKKKTWVRVRIRAQSWVCQTRRGEIERSLSESGVDTCLSISPHMQPLKHLSHVQSLKHFNHVQHLKPLNHVQHLKHLNHAQHLKPLNHLNRDHSDVIFALFLGSFSDHSGNILGASWTHLRNRRSDFFFELLSDPFGVNRTLRT